MASKSQIKYAKWLKKANLIKIQGWARDGLTDEQIAVKMDIQRSTLSQWKQRYPAIKEALAKGKEIVDYEVEESLLKRALGTTTTDIQYKMVQIDEVKLKALRARYVEEYLKNNPNASRKDASISAAENVATFEQIPMIKTIHEIPPDTSAAIFWLKNRRPDIYRDQTFKELNEAQRDKARAEARKAIADAKLAEIEAKEAESAVKTNVTIIDDFTDVESEENNGSQN